MEISISQAAIYIMQMFTGFNFSAGSMSFALQCATPYAIFMLLAAIVCCGTFDKIRIKVSEFETKEELTIKERTLQYMSFAACIVLLAWCIIRLAGGSYNPFIYFRF